MVVQIKILINTILFGLMLGVGQLVPYLEVGEVITLQQILELIFTLLWLGSTIGLVRLISDSRWKDRASHLLAVFSLGKGIHLATNHLNAYTHSAPISQIVYFYDEILSHYLIWIGYLGLIFILITQITQASNFRMSIFMYLLATLHGAILSIAVLEGQSAGIFFIYIFSLGLHRYIMKNKNQSHIASRFYCFSTIVAFGIILSWGVAMRGFPEPSELGLIR
jgi:hypothetical protein